MCKNFKKICGMKYSMYFCSRKDNMDYCFVCKHNKNIQFYL